MRDHPVTRSHSLSLSCFHLLTLKSSRRRGNTGDLLGSRDSKKMKKKSLGWDPASFDFQEMCSVSELLLSAFLACREKAVLAGGWGDETGRRITLIWGWYACFSGVFLLLDHSGQQTPHCSLKVWVYLFSDSTPRPTLWAYHTPKNMFIR